MKQPIFLNSHSRCPKTTTLLPTLLFIILFSIIYVDTTIAATKMLMMNPVRAIFTDRLRTVNVHVINNAEESITYNISLVTLRKGPDGAFNEITANESEHEKMIKRMIRYSPRRATIGPRKRQVIKIMVRKPQDLPAGEYITYLKLSPIGQDPALEKGKASQKEMIHIDVLVNSTFPIIIQHGELASEVTPLSLKIDTFDKTPSSLAARVHFSRKGALSSFGNVFWRRHDTIFFV